MTRNDTPFLACSEDLVSAALTRPLRRRPRRGRTTERPPTPFMRLPASQQRELRALAEQGTIDSALLGAQNALDRLDPLASARRRLAELKQGGR